MIAWSRLNWNWLSKRRASGVFSQPARSTAPPVTKRLQRRELSPVSTPRSMLKKKSRWYWSDHRPTSVYWSMTWSPRAFASLIAFWRHAPSTGCSCARTMPTFALPNWGDRPAWSPMSAIVYLRENRTGWLRKPAGWIQQWSDRSRMFRPGLKKREAPRSRAPSRWRIY